MRYFKTPQNTIRAIEESQEFLIQDDWVEMTESELDAHINPPPTKEQQRNQSQCDRDNALNSMIHTIDGVGDVQVRPRDVINFQTALAGGQSREWVMADNSVATLTVEQMQECLDSGMDQGAAIWDSYIAALKELNS